MVEKEVEKEFKVDAAYGVSELEDTLNSLSKTRMIYKILQRVEDGLFTIISLKKSNG
jgi:hypothetical protein